MSEHESNRLRRIRKLYSLGDFQLALSAATFLSECDRDQKISKVELRRFKSYETTMIVSYCRPFSATTGAATIPALSLKMTGATLTDEQQTLHRKLVDLRNKAFAHSNETMMRMVVKPFEVDVGEGETLTLLETVFDEGLAFLGTDLHDVIGLIRTLYHSLSHQLHREAGENPGKFDIRQDYMKPS